ncbi:MAG: hypothetical protein AAGJ87_01015 [Pseudomonadota bacterium]
MNVEVYRVESLSLGIYAASILIDGEKVAEIKNGERMALTLGEQARELTVRSGPYVSKAFDLADLNGARGLEIEPTSNINAGALVVMTGAAITLSQLFNARVLFGLIVLVILHDLIFAREKWRVRTTS